MASSGPDSSVHQRFSSRLGLLLSTLGVAVGTGNIWRFPRIAAQNGGESGAGAFLVAWAIFLLLWSIPLIIAEYALGRRTRMAPVGVFARATDGRYAWMGAFVAVVASAICFYYAVVVGWCLYYLVRVSTAPLPASTAAAMAMWDEFHAGPLPLVFHVLALGLALLAIWRGVSAIERVNKIFMPTLLVLVAGSAVRALALPGSWEGVAYLFTPDWAQLAHPRVWLEALTQNAWDTGAGWGLFLVYAAYMRQREPVVRNAMITAVGNNCVSLTAGVMVFGTVFALAQHELGLARPEVLEILRTSGPASTGLTLIWMPQLFARMFLGEPVAILFFLALSLAGFTSLIAMLELETRTLIDFGFSRRRAMLIAGGATYLLGVPSAIDLDFFSNQDFVWGVALMLCGAFVALTARRYGVRALREREILGNPADRRLGPAWDTAILWVVPVAAAALLVWWLSLSATVYAPDRWYDPFDPFSVMTCLVQWGAVLAVALLLNRQLARALTPDLDPAATAARRPAPDTPSPR